MPQPTENYEWLDIYKVYYTTNDIFKKTCTIYKKLNTIHLLPNEREKGKEIFEDLFKRLKFAYPNSLFEKNIDGTIGKIRVNKNNVISIRVALPSNGKQSSVMKPGEAYELYFTSAIIDGISEMKELREQMDIPNDIFNAYNNLTLNIFGSNKKISIGPITEATKVGQAGLKPDVRIRCRNKPDVTISLKQGNFSFWSSADTYSPRPLNILKDSISSGKVIFNTTQSGTTSFTNSQGQPIGGIRVPATIEEIKKYCFGGSNGVNYIIISAKNTNFSVKNKIITMQALEIYKNNSQSDIQRMLSDVFLVIKRDPKRNASALPGYRGFSISFVNRNSAYDPRNNYIDA
jgi:hypothetical protein